MPDSVHVGNRALGKNQIEQRLLTGVTPFAIDLQSEHGFNNRGDELSVSPILLESFVKLARSIVDSPEFDGYSRLTETFFKAETGDVAGRLHPFLERAFRQPVDEDTLGRYVEFFRAQRSGGQSFHTAMKSTVAAVLSSPQFLYLLERKPGTGGTKPLSPYELASRLASFIWSSIPRRRADRPRTQRRAGPTRSLPEAGRTPAARPAQQGAGRKLRAPVVAARPPDHGRAGLRALSDLLLAASVANSGRSASTRCSSRCCCSRASWWRIARSCCWSIPTTPIAATSSAPGIGPVRPSAERTTGTASARTT